MTAFVPYVLRHTALMRFGEAAGNNWQINNIEESVLGSDRPLRDGNRYYLAIFEKPADQNSEPFGIYGNGGAVRANIQVNAYGNRRYEGHTILSASDDDLATWFPSLPSQNIDKEVLSHLIEIGQTRNLSAENGTIKSGLKQLGLIDGDDLDLLVISQKSSNYLSAIANIVTPGLEALLRQHLPALQDEYGNSPYKDEITFNKFFIWWYHFFYTQVTNDLAARHLLRVPASGNVTYIVPK